MRSGWSAPVRVTDGALIGDDGPTSFFLSLPMQVCMCSEDARFAFTSPLQSPNKQRVESRSGGQCVWRRCLVIPMMHLPWGSCNLSPRIRSLVPFISFLFCFLFFLFWFVQSINNSWMKLRSRGGCGLTMALLTPTNPCSRLHFFFFFPFSRYHFSLHIFVDSSILFYFIYWVRVSFLRTMLFGVMMQILKENKDKRDAEFNERFKHRKPLLLFFKKNFFFFLCYY